MQQWSSLNSLSIEQGDGGGILHSFSGGLRTRESFSFICRKNRRRRRKKRKQSKSHAINFKFESDKMVGPASFYWDVSLNITSLFVFFSAAIHHSLRKCQFLRRYIAVLELFWDLSWKHIGNRENSKKERKWYTEKCRAIFDSPRGIRQVSYDGFMKKYKHKG